MLLDVEPVVLDELLDDHCDCESIHVYVPECSGDVEYRLVSCRSALNVCAKAVEDPTNGAVVRMYASRCVGCKKPAWECWNILPI